MILPTLLALGCVRDCGALWVWAALQTAELLFFSAQLRYVCLLYVPRELDVNTQDGSSALLPFAAVRGAGAASSMQAQGGSGRCSLAVGGSGPCCAIHVSLTLTHKPTGRVTCFISSDLGKQQFFSCTSYALNALLLVQFLFSLFSCSSCTMQCNSTLQTQNKFPSSFEIKVEDVVSLTALHFLM